MDDYSLSNSIVYFQWPLYIGALIHFVNYWYKGLIYLNKNILYSPFPSNTLCIYKADSEILTYWIRCKGIKQDDFNEIRPVVPQQTSSQIFRHYLDAVKHRNRELKDTLLRYNNKTSVQTKLNHYPLALAFSKHLKTLKYKMQNIGIGQ